MTKIINKKNKKDVQSHINKARLIINEYLPDKYTIKAAERLNGKISQSNIRNTRSGLNNNIEVLNALVEVALEHKANIEKLKKITN